VRRADSLTSTMYRLFRNSGILHLLEPCLDLIRIAVSLGQGLVEGCFEHRNGPLISIKCWGFLDKLKNLSSQE